MIAIDTSVMDAMGDTFLKVVGDTEKEILKSLVGILFPECGDDEGNDDERLLRRRIADVNNTVSDDSFNSSSADNIVGMSSKPWDLVTGESCNVNEDSDADECYNMNGGVSIYLPIVHEETLSYRQLILNEIIGLMDGSKLDSAHPAVVYISYLSIDTKIQEVATTNERDQDTDELVRTTEVTSSVNMVPIAIGAGASGFLFLFAVSYRYRYFVESRRVESIKESQGSPTTDLSNFVEVPLSRM